MAIWTREDHERYQAEKKRLARQRFKQNLKNSANKAIALGKKGLIKVGDVTLAAGEVVMKHSEKYARAQAKQHSHKPRSSKPVKTKSHAKKKQHQSTRRSISDPWGMDGLLDGL